jgi:hypothetical protein
MQGRTFDVRLMRGSAEYLQSLTTSKTIEDEIDQLRCVLLSVCRQTQTPDKDAAGQKMFSFSRSAISRENFKWS